MKTPLFIHIPKTAGSSVNNILSDYETFHHRLVTNYSKKYRDSRFVFSFIRNPYDRLLSSYMYIQGGLGNSWDIECGKKLLPDFNDFVKNQLSDVVTNQLCHGVHWFHFYPLVHWLDDDIDFIGRFENLQQDTNIVCDNIGVPRKQLPHINKSSHKHYTEYYDDESREIVTSLYKQDIDRFNYKFI